MTKKKIDTGIGQINSLYYKRLKISRDKKPVIKEMREVMYA